MVLLKPHTARSFVCRYVHRNHQSLQAQVYFLFFHFYPRVEEGSIVFVPEKPQGQEFIDIIKTTVTTLVPVVITAIIIKQL